MQRSRALYVLLVLFLAGPLTRAEASLVSAGWEVPRGRTIQEFIERAREARLQAFGAPSARTRLVARFRSPVEGHVAARQNGWQVVDLLDSDGTVVLAVPEGQSPESFAPVLSRRSDVLTVEPDHQVRTLSQMADWGVVSVRAPEAHARNQATGKGVTIAIIDSGVDYLHEDLASNIWTNPGEVPDNGIDDDANGYVDDLHGWDFIGGEYTDVREDNDPMDFYGHGTHVAGIAAAADNDVGVLGVAPEATILPVRVVDDRGIGLDTTISQGIQYAAENGADIINMSLGIYALSSTVQRAVVRASERGATLVAAAGNEYYYSIPVYPAGYPSVISVAAGRRRALEKTWWSNWGNVDFVAPGEEVLSAFPQDAYASFFGSSQAAPHVAGALALIKQKHPSFGPVELEQALASTAQDLLFPTRDAVTGSGWIDAEAATGALPDPQFELYSDRYIIPSNGTTASTILARILDGAGAPLAGIRGTFTADRGTLSASEFTTDAAGTARTTLTVDDAHGLATVTASPAGTPARSIQVIVDDDRVRVNDVLIMGVPGGQVFAPPTSQAGLDPGDDLFFKIFLANHRFNVPQRAGATYTVTGPHGNPIPELSGSIEPVIVGVSFFGYWNSQVQARSVVHKIPPTALPGRYLLTVTASSVETGETDTYSTPFWVGESADVLVVRSFYYFDTETYNFFDPSMPRADPGVKAALDSLGRSFDFWDAAELGPPFARDVLSYSTVVWLGGWFPDLAIDALQPYLELGGNLLVSGELFGTWDRAAYSFFPPSTFHRDFLHGTGIFVVDYFDKNHQNYPVSVAGAPGELFEGLTFDINSYNLNSTGETTAIFTDELLVSPTDGASPLFTYPYGLHTPAVAGLKVDTGTFRVVYTGFGIEAINDTGEATLSHLFSKVFDSFNPAPEISSVLPRALPTEGGEFQVVGKNFQPTGTTRVLVDRVEVRADVSSRTSLAATLPPGLAPGSYTVTVINPFGHEAVAEGALTIEAAATPPATAP